jgi:hypothetical protein
VEGPTIKQVTELTFQVNLKAISSEHRLSRHRGIPSHRRKKKLADSPHPLLKASKISTPKLPKAPQKK